MMITTCLILWIPRRDALASGPEGDD
jgi:hypothetical protein